MLTLLRNLSDGEVSVLWQALETESGAQPIHLTTAAGSANDLLWSECAKRGWMVEVPTHDLPAGTKLFALVPDAKQQLHTLLASRASQGLTDHFNRLCQEIPPQIAKPVISLGGTPSDVAMMLAGVVEATMRRFIKADLHDEFLKAVADRTQDLRHFKKSGA